MFNTSISLDTLNSMSKGNMIEHLGIEFTEIQPGFIKAKMPVDHRTHQPMGLLHGGASAALIESIGSMGSTLLLDLEKEAPVGLEVNANHIGSIRSGYVRAIGKIVHAGRRTHLWQVDIFDEASSKLICTGRLTIMVIPK